MPPTLTCGIIENMKKSTVEPKCRECGCRPAASLLAASDIASMLGVAPATIRNWARAGLLPSRKYGKQYRFHRGDVDAWIKNGDHRAS